MIIVDKCDNKDCDHDPSRSPYISHILDIFIRAVKYPILLKPMITSGYATIIFFQTK